MVVVLGGHGGNGGWIDNRAGGAEVDEAGI